MKNKKNNKNNSLEKKIKTSENGKQYYEEVAKEKSENKCPNESKEN